MEYLVRRLEFAAVCVLLIVIFAMFPALVSAAARDQARSRSTSSGVVASDMSNSPNAITRGMGGLLTNLSNTADASTNALDNVAAATSQVSADAGHATLNSGKFVASMTLRSTVAIGRGTWWSVITIGHGAGNGIAFVAGLPGDDFGSITHISLASITIHPANHYDARTIDVDPAALPAATTARAAAKPAQTIASSKVIWPLHGEITTLFGVPELPYEAIHTGLDISDGKPAGITPIHAFKAGKVVYTIHENIKLGNEVIIDHGHGMTSVYGHLNSISVHKGELVTTATVVGYEGTTGVSTGPHLHFEIRINGVPKNPLNFIPGRP